LPTAIPGSRSPIPRPTTPARRSGFSARQPFYEIALIERAKTIAIVMSEMIASNVIKTLAMRLSGIVSVGLNAVEFVKAR